MEYEKSVHTIPSFDGTPLYYEVRGDGPRTLVFVYGIACLMNHWHYQIEHFSKDYRVISYDLRGHHRSGPVPDLTHLSVTELAQDLIFYIVARKKIYHGVRVSLIFGILNMARRIFQ